MLGIMEKVGEIAAREEKRSPVLEVVEGGECIGSGDSTEGSGGNQTPPHVHQCCDSLPPP